MKLEHVRSTDSTGQYKISLHTLKANCRGVWIGAFTTAILPKIQEESVSNETVALECPSPSQKEVNANANEQAA